MRRNGGASDRYHLFHHAVEELNRCRRGSFVIDLFSFLTADDQIGGCELFEVMGGCGAAHAHHGGEVDDTFLTVAQPKNADSVAVTRLLERIGNRLKILLTGHGCKLLFHGLPMVMGQHRICRESPSFLQNSNIL